MKKTFVGVAGGDGECFCWDNVSKEDMLAVLGKERYDLEVNWEIFFLLDHENHHITLEQVEKGQVPISDEIKRKAEEKVKRLYPNDLVESLGFGDYDKKLRFTIEIEDVE